jgi:hypothetical protein
MRNLDDVGSPRTQNVKTAIAAVTKTDFEYLTMVAGYQAQWQGVMCAPTRRKEDADC